MGYLTRTAEKTFKRAGRRAHVPDWFQPASYVLVGGLAVVVAVSVTFSGGSPTTKPVETSLPGFMVPISTSPPPVSVTPSSQVTSPPTPSAPVTATPGAETVFVDESGVQVSVPTAAVEAAVRAVVALFTGEYAGVLLAEGQQPVLPAVRFTDPEINGPVTALRFPDDSWRIGFNVDPDRTGPEAPRRVGVTMFASTEGWKLGG